MSAQLHCGKSAGAHWITRSTGVAAKRKLAGPCRESNPSRLAHTAVIYRWRYGVIILKLNIPEEYFTELRMELCFESFSFYIRDNVSAISYTGKLWISIPLCRRKSVTSG